MLSRFFSLCMSNCTRVFWFFSLSQNLLTLLVCVLLSQIVGAWVRNSLFLIFLNLVPAIFFKKENRLPKYNLLFVPKWFFSFCTFQLRIQLFFSLSYNIRSMYFLKNSIANSTTNCVGCSRSSKIFLENYLVTFLFSFF